MLTKATTILTKATNPTLLTIKDSNLTNHLFIRTKINTISTCRKTKIIATDQIVDGKGQLAKGYDWEVGNGE